MSSFTCYLSYILLVPILLVCADSSKISHLSLAWDVITGGAVSPDPSPARHSSKAPPSAAYQSTTSSSFAIYSKHSRDAHHSLATRRPHKATTHRCGLALTMRCYNAP